ncbi:MAG TPA: M14 family metallopeptidase [Bryobacteraceae bacterium]
MYPRLLVYLAAPFLLLSQNPSPVPPHSAFEPPAAAKAESIAASTQAAPKDFLTVAETSQFQETGRYAESLALYAKFVKASPFAKLVTLGQTPQGRDIVMLIVSKDKAFTPEAAAKTGKPVVLLQNGIHGGEIAGKDASALLIRDLIITKRLASLLDNAIVLSIPVFNVDGHERVGPYNRLNQNGPREIGWRATAQRLDLNRDYMKADSPEMQAFLAMYTKWLPDLLIDNQVTDGEDHQYDITYAAATGPDVAPSVAAWTRDKLLPALLSRLETGGHLVAPYGTFENAMTGYHGMAFQPRSSNGYAATQNRVGLLIETHSLKSYRTRVWAHYDLMVHALELTAGLHAAVAKADRDVADMAGSDIKVHLDGAMGKEGVAFDYKGVGQMQQQSALTKGFFTVYFDSPINTSTLLYNQLETTVAETLPAAYLIPRQWTVLIELLHLHGVKTESLDHEGQFQATSVRLLHPQWNEQPFEGRHRVEYRIERHDERRTFPAGTVLVRMDQRAARVALNLLEPDAPDSAVKWGMIDTIFEQKQDAASFVLEPLAQSLEQERDELRVVYQKRLREDRQFAADPNARLQWWYERSPYAEVDHYLYPVYRINEAPARSPAATAPKERRSPPPLPRSGSARRNAP